MYYKWLLDYILNIPTTVLENLHLDLKFDQIVFNIE